MIGAALYACRVLPGAWFDLYSPGVMGDLLNHQKEWLSRAFVQAVAATAGYSTQFPGDDIYGTDAVVRDGGVTVEFQLKATASPNFDRDLLKFDLDVSTYDKLRDTVRGAPGYLLVVAVPDDPSDWLRHSTTELAVRHCGYWLPLIGMPATRNRKRIRLSLPRVNQMTVAHMSDIMQSARARLS